MSKKKIFLTVGVVVFILVFLGTIAFGWNRRKLNSSVSPLGEPAGFIESKPASLLPYEDEAGFSFQYPESLGVVEKEVNDSSVYSSLEFLNKEHPGEKLVIRISDTKNPTPEKWLEQNSQAGNLLSTTKVILSGMEGKSFKYTSPARNLILVVDSGILYYFESPSDKGFWDQALTTVSSTFKLAEKASVPGNASGGGDETSIIEEEEVIE